MRQIIALTGAGISVTAGIKTFEENPKLRDILTRDFASENPSIYNKTIKKMIKNVQDKEPTIAHELLALNKIEVVTMNIDGLHAKAGTNAIELHGRLPKLEDADNAAMLLEQPVLYGDIAPKYLEGIKKISELGNGDILLVIGVSGHTSIAKTLIEMAYINGAEIITMNNSADFELNDFFSKNEMLCLSEM